MLRKPRLVSCHRQLQSFHQEQSSTKQSTIPVHVNMACHCPLRQRNALAWHRTASLIPSGLLPLPILGEDGKMSKIVLKM